MLSTRLVPSSPRRLGSLRHSRQGCLRYQDNPVTDNLWMRRQGRSLASCACGWEGECGRSFA